MTKKRILILSGAALILVIAVWQIWFSGGQSAFNYEEVKKSDINQEVSVSGNVTKGKEIGLNFAVSGKIQKNYVQVGDEVEADQKLSELDASQLSIQFQAASAQLKTAQINLEKLVAGASAQDVSLYETALKNAQESYRSAQQTYNDTITLADTTLDNLYKSSLNDFADYNAKLYNASIFLQSNMYSSDSRDVEAVRAQSEKIQNAYQESKSALALAQSDGEQASIDAAVGKTISALQVARDALLAVKEIWENRSSASADQKTSLTTHQTYVNTALSSAGDAQDSIALAKASNQSNINTAYAAMTLAEGQVNVAQANLDKLLAAPRQEDVRLAQAQVDQAQAQANLLAKQIRDASLKAPVAGKIAQVNKEEGEMVSSVSTQDFIVLMPKEPFQVEVNVPEVDIGKVAVGNSCEIDLDAFPEEKFSGKAIKIDPAQTVISGVIYYKTTISLDTEDQRIKQGMTANVAIVTASKSGVLNVPQRAIIEKDGKKMVRVVSGNSYKEVEVQTGLKGVNGEVEISAGLNEGDKVVTFIKGE